MKKIWITSLIESEEAVGKIIQQTRQYGIEANGHFWKNDLEKFLWQDIQNELLNPQIDLWLIFANKTDWENSETRYGLSMLSILIQSRKRLDFPIVILQNDNNDIQPNTLPTPFRNVTIMSTSNPGYAAKLVAKLHAPVTKQSLEYRLDVQGNIQVGQWFEIGPTAGEWDGVILGVEKSISSIEFHATGPKGRLPEKATLNYPIKDMELSYNNKKYTAWAVKNKLTDNDSYYVKVKGYSGSMVFGHYADDAYLDLFVVRF